MSRPVVRRLDFSQGWLFGGPYTAGAEQPGFDDRGFTAVTLPHTVTPLSWADWDVRAWQDRWIYRRHFARPPGGGRVLVDFDGVMTSATVALNGTTVATHQGGYLPWSAELTAALADGDNVLAVIVDATWQNVPPGGSPAGPAAVDYLQPGGIYREVTLRVVPEVFLADVFARPSGVLGPDPSLTVQATIDAAVVPRGPARLTAELLDGSRPVASASATVTIPATGQTITSLLINGLGPVGLWSPGSPRLYTVRTSLDGGPDTGAGAADVVEVRTGFREAVFRPDGFYLNGQRLPIFGLNRHQLFPYLGMAAPARLQRRDAELIRTELNCNMVRCSHYPPSPHFLDACDELGLMVWEEPPGWQYVGDAAFSELVVRDVHDMVVRDRSRPSVIIWGTRLNESGRADALYQRTRQVADRLDGSRPTSGAMASYSAAGWAQDVFAYDDYHHTADGDAVLNPPLPGRPYLVAEAVGALAGPPRYRWTDTGAVLAAQGRLHAQVHSRVRADPGYAGLLGWCAIDYASLNGGERIWRNLKTPGLLDTFRVPKPGAALYRSQVSPQVRPVIGPMFRWDFGPGAPPDGPGPGAMIATNCDRLELYLAGRHHATAVPDAASYPGLAYPPAVADLTADGAGRPELRIDGYVGGTLAATVTMSADTSRDRLALWPDHTALRADGADATRLTFRAVDAYGHHRPYVTGPVTLSLTGPATLIGDNPFPFGDCGGVGGAFVRSWPGRPGRVTVRAEHATLGQAATGLVTSSAW
ncbi:MAG: glycoside hydrolase family 2 TIM barrel-domain containing protein [Streptosporangiaceae bacterium]